MTLNSQAVAAAIALIISSQAIAKDDSAWGPPYWSPSGKLIRRLEHRLTSLERHVQMPAAPGDRPEAIARYARYYSGLSYRARKVIIGEMVLPNGFLKESAGTYVVSPDDLPVVADGGCSVIWLSYEAATGKILWIRCNPVR